MMITTPLYRPVSVLRLMSPLIALAAALIANTSLAQTADQQEPIQWYQVEVYIFANDAAYAGTTEQWPEDVELAYPKQLVQLQNTGFSPATTETAPADSFAVASHSPMVQQSTVTIYEQQVAIDSPEPPFVKLPEDQYLLSQAAARLSRQGSYRTLFHQAWRQPVLSRDESTSILIRGGERFDDHFELEGSINLSVERYLHIKTDLWLSTFKSAAGLEFSWPKLPPLPFNSTDPAVTRPVASPEENFGLNYGPSSLSLMAMHNRLYQVDRTVVLQQSRRMRSEELHYLDHPLLGMLIKVVPYEVPEPVQEEKPQEGIEQPEAADADNSLQ